MKPPHPPILFLTLLGFAPGVPAFAAGPVITEIDAGSGGSLLDQDGEASDWIEVQNTGGAPVNLQGWALSDDAGNLLRWRFPAVTLDAGAFLVVFASGKDRAAAGAELHTDFKLDADGEYLALVEPDGATIATEFSPSFPPQHEGYSFGLGRKVLEPGLVARGSPAAVIVPSSGAQGLSWTGGSEPFDDSPAAGWIPASLGVGYPGGGGAEPPVPIAYYDFDGAAQDRSGNGHHAELRGGAVFSADVPAALAGGKSVSLDGLDDYVSAALDVSEAAHTVSLWFKADAGGHGLFTVTDGDLGAGGYDRLLYLSGGNLAARVWNNETIASAGKSYADRKWRHAVHVVGGWAGGQRLYVDGQLVATGAKGNSDFDWQQRINIGFSNDAGAPYFDGLIDDVSVWDVALSESQIQALAAGAHPMALSGYGPWIATDVALPMRGVNASLHVRVPFDAALPAPFDSLLLRVRYDDGIVLYLNGVEVARRNAPSVLAFDSQAASDRPVGAAIRPEEIELGPRLDLLHSGRNILAFHALNDAPGGTDFLLEAELVGVEGNENRFLSPPTPGGPNSVGVTDFVAEVSFSVERGFYSAPFAVEIATVTPGAQVLYTTDGSAPGPSNPAAVSYSSPVRVSTTTTLRAAAFKADHEPSNVGTQTYIFTSSVARQPVSPPGLPLTWAGGYPADYPVDPDVVNAALPGFGFEDALLAVPTMSLTADPDDLFGAVRGIYSNPYGRGPSWERAASIELIHPDGRRGFDASCGIRMHGNSSRDHGFTPKHPIRLLFRAEYGQKKLKHALFEDSKVDSFDELLLRGCSTDSWPVVDGGSVRGVQRWAAVHATYLRDQWMRDAQIAMGRPSCHGTYVHLYLNGLYWGLYNLAERPVDSFCASHLGGEKEEYDIVKDFAELQSGNGDAWSAMLSLAGAGLASDAAYHRIQGNNPDGTRNPAYPVYLDADNLIDYMVLHITAGAEDWPHHNWWAARRRGPKSTGFKFFSWDQEISNDSLVRTHTLFETRFEDPVSSPSPSYLYGQCRANASFRRAFGDRVQKHLFGGGLLSPGASSGRWMARQGEIDRAIVAESARWGDARRAVPYRRESEWLAEENWMRNVYWPQVHPIAVERFRRVGLYPAVEAPAFEVNGEPRHGGFIARGDLLTMSAPARNVSYTLDGTDPTSPSAFQYSGPIALERTSVVKARARDGAVWSALSEAVFTDPEDLPLRVSEVHYHPRLPPPGSPFDEDEYELIEILNAGAVDTSLSGVRLEGGVEFDFATAAVSRLAPGERLVIARNVDAFASRYNIAGITIAGEYAGKLSNEGERLVLRGPLGETLLDFRYEAFWYPETDGGGRSLVVADAGASPASWGSKESWRPSASTDGSPGEPEPGEGGRGLQLPGDSNQDGSLDLADAISLLFRLFGGAAMTLPCAGAGIGDAGNGTLLDSNGDTRVSLSDAVHVLAHLFRGGPPPALGMRCARIEGCPDTCGR